MNHSAKTLTSRLPRRVAMHGRMVRPERAAVFFSQVGRSSVFGLAVDWMETMRHDGGLLGMMVGLSDVELASCSAVPACMGGARVAGCLLWAMPLVDDGLRPFPIGLPL
jgi:hypothetical protein